MVPQSAYKELVDNITHIYRNATLEAQEQARKIRTAAYWKVGESIVKIEQSSNLGIKYGDKLLERLSSDLTASLGNGFSTTNLKYMRQFYASFPIGHARDQLHWTHYRVLLSIKDKEKREIYQEKAIKENLSHRDLRSLLRTDKVATQNLAPTNKPKTTETDNIPEILEFSRGKLNTYKIAKPKLVKSEDSEIIFDMGFSIKRTLDKNDNILALATDAPQFTYIAYVDKVIDGDTLWVEVDCGFNTSIRQKIRLRGIDCPEIATKSGQEAKELVETCLKDLPFIIIKTYKTDKYDRYLADVFYGQGEAEEVAKNGDFLNQFLLDKKLAKIFKA